jgi:L-asparaginase
VTQGTDTLEETSYAFELLTELDTPVVFTGAMRNASLPGPDGPANLLAAIRVAASPRARGLGTVVVFSDEIHASRHVRKRHASSTAAFGSPLTGPLGHVTEGRVRIMVRPTGRLHVRVPPDARDVHVAQVTVSFEDDGRLIGAVPSLGYGGLVLAAFGGGHVPSWTVPILARVAGQIPVVLASRTTAGEGLTGSYEYPGSETDLIGRGLIPGGSLGAAHAAVLLRLLLMAGMDRGELGLAFERASDPHGLVTVP